MWYSKVIIIKNILNYKAMLNKMVVNVFIILIKVY